MCAGTAVVFRSGREPVARAQSFVDAETEFRLPAEFERFVRCPEDIGGDERRVFKSRGVVGQIEIPQSLHAAAGDRRTGMERGSDAPEKNDPVCEIQIERFIREHFQQNLPLKKLAALCHYSVSQLVRRFRRRYGVTPIARQLEIRLDHAAQLLQSTELTVSEIAYRCGFSTCTYFSRRFRLRYGVSPTRFRLRE